MARHTTGAPSASLQRGLRDDGAVTRPIAAEPRAGATLARTARTPCSVVRRWRSQRAALAADAALAARLRRRRRPLVVAFVSDRIPYMHERATRDLAVGDRIHSHGTAVEIIAIECRLCRLRFTLRKVRDGVPTGEAWQRSFAPTAMVLRVSRSSSTPSLAPAHE